MERAFQAMTAVMLESARKGYWKASDEQLKTTASLHAQITREKGAACTEFVCDNDKLQSFVADQLDNCLLYTSQQGVFSRSLEVTDSNALFFVGHVSQGHLLGNMRFV